MTTNWKKTHDSKVLLVWENKKFNRRLVARKGKLTWQAWTEKAVGIIGSDKAYLPNARIMSGTNKTTAANAIIKHKEKLDIYFKKYTVALK